jgi:hypothetical protein
MELYLHSLIRLHDLVLYKLSTGTNLSLMGKVKVKMSVCLIEHYAMKAYGGSGCIDPRFLDLGTSGIFHGYSFVFLISVLVLH